MKNIVFLLILILGLLSCKNAPKTPQGRFGDLPPLPESAVKRLTSETTYIDYIFYDLPFSISQDDKPSISSNLNLISQEKMGPIAEGCKSIGREFFHINGNIEFEAEIYFQNGCYGYVFIDKEKPIYANKISPSGMKFYANIINQAEQIKNKALNGG